MSVKYEIPSYDPRLGRHVNHDDRSRAFRVTQRETTIIKTLWQRFIDILDQGNLGSCTGNAGTGAMGSSDLYDTVKDAWTRAFGSWNEEGAVALYSAATKLDDDKDNYPPTDTGSDGLSIAKALKAAGMISGYQHGFSVDDMITMLQTRGVIMGSNWYTGMFYPDTKGVVKISGSVEGGHEYLVRGYDPATQMFSCDNSWGIGWGVNGSFSMSKATVTRLLKEDGDVTMFIPNTEPAPVPVPDPKPSPSILQTLFAELEDILAKVKVALGL